MKLRGHPKSLAMLDDDCFEPSTAYFAGSPYADKQKEALHKKLDEALEIIGGLQQPIHADSEISYKSQVEHNAAQLAELRKISKTFEQLFSIAYEE